MVRLKIILVGVKDKLSSNLNLKHHTNGEKEEIVLMIYF
jgi:hypothetical protein